MGFMNVYEDSLRAESYSELEFPGTYYLAYRDLPAIISKHVSGEKAIDFGCGAGRSTRFLRKYGFEATGIDISEDMISCARKKDPGGDYRLVKEGEMGKLKEDLYDLILSVFTFDNIPTMKKKTSLFRKFNSLLNKSGRIINLVSSPDIYVNEWASFTTKDFPKNSFAASGDKVKIIMKDVDDKRPVEDIIWSGEDYVEVFDSAGLSVDAVYRPLAEDFEPFEWINETKIAPWVIYVLKKAI